MPRRLEHALSLASARENTDYLPGERLDESIQIGLEPLPALMDAELVFLACPSKGLPALLAQIGPAVRDSSTVMAISLCKGLDQATLLRPSELMARAFGPIPVATLSGPSNAAEVARGLPTALVLAAERDDATLRAVQLLGRQFVLGQSMDEAMKEANAARKQGQGLTYSYDMLGEGARTEADAERYQASYLNAIAAIARQLAWHRRSGARRGGAADLRFSHFHRLRIDPHDPVVRRRHRGGRSASWTTSISGCSPRQKRPASSSVPIPRTSLSTNPGRRRR